MTHFSEDCNRLTINHIPVTGMGYDNGQLPDINDVAVVILPVAKQGQRSNPVGFLKPLLDDVAGRIGPNATLVTVGETADLVHVHTHVSSILNYQLWITIKRTNPKIFDDKMALTEHHFGALVHTKYSGSLNHTKTRIEYTYCPFCEKTTKDYGGKKHTYNSFGTLVSDVWRDISVDIDGNLDIVIERFADLFGVDKYNELVVLDYRQTAVPASIAEETSDYVRQTSFLSPSRPEPDQSRLVLGDALEELRKLPDDSVDFAFADPPYNLSKKYNSYSDDLSVTEYFEWCDEWIGELTRVLKPDRTCAILNIPLWDIRHFLHLENMLQFQNWIAWDALSFPVRQIMPAHYGILCFTKGPSRKLPGLVDDEKFTLSNSSKTFLPLEPLAEWYCLRSTCVKTRRLMNIDDRGPLTDLWWDTHRLKHNSRRVDHPCQLPPQLMYRLITIFTKPEEVVLDCFNGAGTTTLTAHQLNRRYIGIEFSEKYHQIAMSRHQEIVNGIDPFRKAKRKLTEKNSPVERMPSRKYEVPKKTLQLEVRRVAQMLDKLPNRDEMLQHGKYPIKYYDEYFVSWGEVCAAARHDGMSEEKYKGQKSSAKSKQLSMF